MDRAEAGRLLREEMIRLAARLHSELMRLVADVDAYEVRGRDGVDYQVEVQARWVEEPGGSLQVLAGIDDGSFRGAFRPVTDGFLKGPDGTAEIGPLLGT
jgi:hypothetical protein